MPTLETTVDGLKLPNPFVIGSGPPGTNLNVITRAFREGWGAVGRAWGLVAGLILADILLALRFAIVSRRPIRRF